MGLGRVIVVRDCILVDLILHLHSYILCFLYWGIALPLGWGWVIVVQDCILVDLILHLHSYILCFLSWECIFSLSLGRYQSQDTFLLKFLVPRFIITFTMMTWQFIQKLTNYVSWTLYSMLSPQWNEGKGRAIPPSIRTPHGTVYLISTDKRPPPTS